MTADQLAKKMAARQRRAETEFRQTTRAVAISALKFCKERLTEEIYAIPEDVSSTGRKKWRRTGNLRRSEKFDIRSPYEVAIINTANYAFPRHEAGKPGHRNINPLRISHWRDELLETFHPLMLDLYHSTVEAILKAEGS